MMKKTIFLSTVLSVLILISCQTNHLVKSDNSSKTNLQEDMKNKSSLDFEIDLFKKIAISENENMMISPISAKIAINMLMNGADGETLFEIKRALAQNNLSNQAINNNYQPLLNKLHNADENIKLTLANAIFHDKQLQLKSKFHSDINDYYQAKIEAIELSNEKEAIKTINQWASDNTNNKIPKVIEKINPNQSLFLMNAIYFKGDWTNKFRSTYPASFTLVDNKTVKVPTMFGKIPIKHKIKDNYQIVELNYGNRNFVMDIILPNNDLPAFLMDFNVDKYNEAISSIDALTSTTSYEVELPKFKFEYQKQLNKELKGMGMISAFQKGRANFSNLSDKPTFVSFIKQNSFIDVNETGTEAAAVTSIGMVTTSIQKLPSVKINKPFIFLIREKTTNTLLFIGTVFNPTK